MKKIFELEQEIKRKIQERIFGLKLKIVEKDVKKEPNIIIGNIPAEKIEELIPAITIRTPNGKNTLSDKKINLNINIGIFEKDSEEAYKSIYDLLDKISKRIISSGILLEEFEILPEYEWELAEEQPYPYWMGKLSFNILMKEDYRTDIDDWISGK